MADYSGAVLSEEQVAALPEPLKAQFAKGEDGKWAQKVPDPNEDTTELKSALEWNKERLKAAQEKHQKDMARFKGIDPEKYAAAVQKLEEAERAKLKAEGKEQELWERQRVSLEEAHGKSLAEKDDQIKMLEAKLSGVLIDDGAVSLVASLPGFKNTEKAVELLKRIARDELQVIGDVVTPVERDGSPRVAQGRTMTAKEWAEGLVKEYGDILFEGSSGGGATNGKGGSPSGKALKDMSPAEKAVEIRTLGLTKFQERVASENSGART